MKTFRYLFILLLAFSASGGYSQSLKYAANTQNNGVKVVGNTLQFLVNGVSFNMIYVKGGSFTMGATSEQTGYDRDERPTHHVQVKDYYIGECEVTQELWEIVMGTTIENQRDKACRAWALRGVGEQYPMYYVSYEDVLIFIEKLNELTGKKFSLPTEVQWEFVARGGKKASKKVYSGDSDIDNVAWYSGNSSNTHHEVAQKSANELGVYDMSGSVWEWCLDYYDIDTYKRSAKAKKHISPEYGEDVVLRGGCINTEADACRVSNRGHMNPSYRNSYTGFRLVLTK